MSHQRVVLVEDDETIGANLLRVLSDTWTTTWVTDGGSAIAEIDDETSLALVDLGLPDIDGIDLCRTLVSKFPRLPIIIVTARDAELDAVIGLDAGAVDYVTKPFHLNELQARIRAHLRHNEGRTPTIVKVGALVVDTAARNVTANDVELELRPKEFDLLAELARHAGQALDRGDLMHAVWDEHWYGSTKTLDVHIAALRRKLDATGTERPVVITTLRGVGYRLEAP
jgi:DNA-binding response OmpR family regulator